LRIIGGYTVTREVGRGGMGRVFEGLSPEGHTVAIKIMNLPERSGPRARWEAVERFQREARAAQSLDHPSIVHVLDVGLDQDSFYIVMEFVDGQSVGELIQVGGAIERARAVAIVIAVCDALAYAHDRGVIHRDLKPDNILLPRDGGAKVTDFGLAAIIADTRLTQPGLLLGTLGYMSPEQTRGEELDARSDLFSLGATFYEMITGRQLFSGDSPAEVIHRICTQDVPLVPGLPSAIQDTLAKCLARDRSKRFSSAREVTASLRAELQAQHASHTSVLAAPAGLPVVGPSQLPTELTAFVGRHQELAAVARLLCDAGVRLLTLTGPPGVGKTRLALEAARNCQTMFRDGVALVELERTRDPEAVPTLMANAIGMRLEAGPPVVDQLAQSLSGRQFLLICDNFEQVSGAAQVLSHLLRAAPGVRCIVTSRAALRVRGERLFEVPPMTLPPPGAPADDLWQYDSSALFLARAQDAGGAIARGSHAAAMVASICRRVEGIPLSVELAAARVRTMSLEEILSGLDDRLRLLQSRAVDIPTRQRTLEAAIGWSYELLQDPERHALCQLSVFRGGFSADSAQAVTEDDSVPGAIDELVTHSLLTARPVGDGMRYSMLEAVRQFAAGCAVSFDAVRYRGSQQRHATWFTELAEDRRRRIRTPDDSRATRDMVRELDNCRAALEWAYANDGPLCARLASAVQPFLERRGCWQEAALWIERGLDAARAAGAKENELHLLLDLASSHYDRGQLAPARGAAQDALVLARAVGDVVGQGRALNLVGIAAHALGDDEMAVTSHESALSLREAGLDHLSQAISLHDLGLIAQHRGDTEVARDYYHRALGVRREVGDLQGIAETLCNLGVLAQDAGDHESARSYYRECLTIWSNMGDLYGAAVALNNLGEIEATAGDARTALVLFVASGDVLRRIGSPAADVPRRSLGLLRDHAEGQPFEEQLGSARVMSWSAVLRLAGVASSAEADDLGPGAEVGSS